MIRRHGRGGQHGHRRGGGRSDRLGRGDNRLGRGDNRLGRGGHRLGRGGGDGRLRRNRHPRGGRGHLAVHPRLRRGPSLRSGGGADGRAGAVAPVAWRGRARRGVAGRGSHAQHTQDNLGLGAVIPADLVEPEAVVGWRVNPVEAAGDVAQQGEGQLRTKARRQMDGVLDRVAPATAQVELSKVGVNLTEVRHGRDDPVFQDLHRDHVLDADAHGVAGEALGVGDDDGVCRRAEALAQGGHLGGGAAATGGGEGLVRHEDELRGDGGAVDTKAALGGGDQPIHHLRDMIDIEAGAVEGAVGGLAGQHLDDPAHTALADGVLALDHQGAGAHAEQRAVAALVEGQGGGSNLIVGGGGAGGQEASPDPLHELIARDLIAGDDQDAAAATAPDPVLGHANGLGGGGAGGIDRRVRAARADVLGKLAVAHGQHAEEEAPVEAVGLAGQLLAQGRTAPTDLVQGGRVADHTAQLIELLKLGLAVLEGMVALQLVGHAIHAGEGRGEDHAGLVTQGLGEHPATGQVGAPAGAVVGLHERQTRLAQGVQAGGHGHLGGAVERLDQRGRHAILGVQVEVARAPGQADDIGGLVDQGKMAAAIVALHQPDDVLAQHEVAEALGDEVDELLAAQDAQDVVGVHQGLGGTGQAEAGAADHNRPERRGVAVEGLRAAGGSLRLRALDGLGQQGTESF